MKQGFVDLQWNVIDAAINEWRKRQLITAKYTLCAESSLQEVFEKVLIKYCSIAFKYHLNTLLFNYLTTLALSVISCRSVCISDPIKHKII